MTKGITILTKKIAKNQLLDRTQFVIDVIHTESGVCSKKDLQQLISKKYNAPLEQVVIFGLRTKFGGNKSTAFGLIYGSKDSLRKFEPKHRLIKQGVLEKAKVTTSRKTKKDLKNKIKKLRGKAKTLALKGQAKKK